MMADVGILSFGAYVPRRRLQRSAIYAANSWFAPGLKGLAKGERAVGDWDEDTITMAVEAGRDALTGIDRSSIGSLSLASTTLPYADRLNSGIVKEASARGLPPCATRSRRRRAARRRTSAWRPRCAEPVRRPTSN
jgi:hydroxymethylglutaryl-CoA synthase